MSYLKSCATYMSFKASSLNVYAQRLRGKASFFQLVPGCFAYLPYEIIQTSKCKCNSTTTTKEKKLVNQSMKLRHFPAQHPERIIIRKFSQYKQKNLMETTFEGKIIFIVSLGIQYLSKILMPCKKVLPTKKVQTL